MGNGVFLIRFQMSPTLIEAISYINSSEKKIVQAKTVFDSLTTLQFSSVLFPMTYKANRTFYLDVEIATVLLVLKPKNIACDQVHLVFGRFLDPVPRKKSSGAWKSLSR